ncbi:MAG: hypothetical protein II841_08845 [Bacteroidales bacterium]|nr:hypothetical protein [Bacteroidales bacterium]
MARKNLNVTLKISELLYEIRNKTWLTGQSRQNGQNFEEVANMQNNEDEEHVNQVLRSLGNAFATLKVRLSEYIDTTQTTANDIQITGNTDLTVSLVLPSNYNQATADAIALAMHQYLVNTAIAEWFTITNKTDAADYFTLAGANITQIREAVSKRVRPTRIVPSA